MQEILGIDKEYQFTGKTAKASSLENKKKKKISLTSQLYYFLTKYRTTWIYLFLFNLTHFSGTESFFWHSSKLKLVFKVDWHNASVGSHEC